jgi:hypothetical protein
LAARWCKIVTRHAFGEHGPGIAVDLTAMEQVAHATPTSPASSELATYPFASRARACSMSNTVEFFLRTSSFVVA